MLFERGNLVTRKSYNNDIIFKIVDIVDGIAILKGINMRLCADSEIEDLQKYEKNADENIEDDEPYIEKLNDLINFDRNEYFYIPGRILHIDGDEEYLRRCLRFYKEGKIQAFGIHISEEDMPKQIMRHLEELKPDILVITGHDAYYRKREYNDKDQNYKNTSNFIKTIQEVRKYEKAHDKLIVVSGACQSNYEALIKAGANFASSPKRINIHALDPAIIALTVSLSDKNKDIDLLGILAKTKYGPSGIGGIITKGTMYIGYPK